jgi:hypothetical protein
MTSVALLACASLGTAGTGDRERRVSAAAGWLVGEPVFRLDWRTRALFRWRQFRGDPAITELNDALIGWPWVEGTFSWVEPTSLALLGLRAAARVAPNIARSSGFADRVRSAERMLVDRVVPGGGWNYGNTRVLGQDLSPYPDTTAWALLALRGVRDVEGVDRAVTTGLDRLVALIAENRSSLARSLAALALRAHGRDDAAWRAAIAERVVTAPPRETRTRALALLALAGPAVPFGA